MVSPPASGAALLDASLRRRGRRLALLSHPAGMTHQTVYTEQLPTLALVGLGASEAVIGLQRSLDPALQLLQLGALRLVGRVRKRTILLAGQGLAVLGSLPLVAYAWLAAAGGGHGEAVALGSLVVATAGFAIAGSVWFPLLRGYVEPGRVGHFFGLLRTGWNLTLIGYFLVAERWLEVHPGAFGALFAAGTVAGLVRMAMVARLPEAGAPDGTAVSVRRALALVREEPRLRRYLGGMVLFGAARRVVTPFAIVMMRRVLGLSDADVVLATAAFYGGGFVSLYGWGRLVDRLGPLPVFRTTALAAAALLATLGLFGSQASGAAMVAFFFVLAVLAAGFGVADTHVLFGMTPEDEPAPLLVVADVATSLAYGAAPLAAGLALDAAFGAGVTAAAGYRALFLVAAACAALAPAPLRGFRTEREGG
jgi:predicted MFS family arabinose efflux permease